ncbi:hypothetical protein LTR84_008799 [Exophiala bonariae]|uniref:Pyruvate decarboxylase n=1 Tax=Exophiala bonariae TaxID=1690606 RepID=A0AAV9MZN5_9EURO|nr:hypothetical protein LTR84_008799 [Exophiala bonariae]
MGDATDNSGDIAVGRYLFERIKQLGVKSVFGVPGDYELVLLDMVPETGLTWRGSPNELNASYAADGYARTNGYSAFISTFGPGELSAYCGVGGSYTEYVPSVHIVGYPPSRAMNDHLIMHHSLGDGQFGMYHEMSKHISVATTVITSTLNAAAEIDRVLNAMIHYSRPVYIGLAVDIGPQKVSSAGLQTPLCLEQPKNDPELQEFVVKKIVDAVRKVDKAVVIVDGLAIRNRLVTETEALVKAAGVLYFTTFMSKGFTESLPNFGGVYGGAGSVPGVQNAIETADTVLWIGSYSSDFNTGEFSERVRSDVIIDFQRSTLQIGSKKHPLNFKEVLIAVTYALEAVPSRKPSTELVTWDANAWDHPEKPIKLTQDYLWPALGRYFRSKDLVIAETGTSSYGIPIANLKGKDLSLYNQTIYGSIGFATGASVGSFVAARESGDVNRPILITGEGSLQLTVQALSDLIRFELGATIFLVNNDGYTVERLIHGPEADYNKVPIWDYSKLGELFGPAQTKAGKFKYYNARTPDDLETILADTDFAEKNPANGTTQVVELFLDTLDQPVTIPLITKAIEEFNKVK